MSETSPLSEFGYTAADVNGEVGLDDPRLASVDRLRFLTDPGFPVWEVSYCWGTLRDGTHVRVQTGIYTAPKRRGGIAGEIIRAANEAGVSAKRLGMFDAVSTLI